MGGGSHPPREWIPTQNSSWWASPGLGPMGPAGQWISRKWSGKGQGKVKCNEIECRRKIYLVVTLCIPLNFALVYALVSFQILLLIIDDWASLS